MWGGNHTLHIKQSGKGRMRFRGQICLGGGGGGGVKHSYKVAVGTGEAVFLDRVHILTALRLWSCTFKRLPWMNPKSRQRSLSACSANREKTGARAEAPIRTLSENEELRR